MISEKSVNFREKLFFLKILWYNCIILLIWEGDWMLSGKEKEVRGKKNMKKRWIIGLLCLCLAGAVTGCKEKSSKPGNSDTEQEISRNVELGTYKGVEVTMQSTEVTEEEVQTQLEAFVTGVKLEVTDHTDVRDGDMVNMNYSGKVDGEVFQGGTDDTEKGTDLVIGSGKFIPGFEAQLVGHQVGETFDINVVFPNDYRQEGTNGSELNGKEAVFTVTINSLKRYATMEDLNDQFIAEHSGNYGSIEEWKTAKTEEIKKTKEQQADNQFKLDAMKAVINNAEFKDDLTKDIEALETNMKNYYQAAASQYGIDFATFLAIFLGMTEEQFNKEVAESAEISIKQQIVGMKIIEAENLELTDEEYTTGLAELAAGVGADSPEAYETENGKDIVRQQLLLNKAYQLIFDNVVKK